MIKKLFLLCFLLGSFNIFAQRTFTIKHLQQLQRKSLQTKIPHTIDKRILEKANTFVGTGTDTATLVIVWNDGKGLDTLLYRYCFSGEKTGEDMLREVVKYDARLYAVISIHETYGVAINGIGYDLDDNASTTVMNKGLKYVNPKRIYAGKNFNVLQATDEKDHFVSGYDSDTQKFLNYLVADKETALVSSSVGASSRVLKNGSVDVWVYKTWEKPFSLSSVNEVPPTRVYQNGVFVLNEDWFGHKSSSINFVDTNQQWTDTAYALTNPYHTLGTTSQYGTIYGGKLYICSKQHYKTTGGRLTIANAQSLKQIKDFETLPNRADSRAFAVVNEEKAYMSTSKGLLSYDIQQDTFIKVLNIEAVEMGNIAVLGNYAFVECQGRKVLVIDTKTDSLVKTLEDGYCPVISKDKRLWIASQTALKGYNVKTLELEKTIDVTNIAPPINMNGAWNAGLFFAGNKSNTLYWGKANGWAGANTIYCVNLDEKEALPKIIFTIPSGNTKNIYGAAMRLHPKNDHLFLQTYKDFGTRNYEFYELSAEGNLLHKSALTPHYWFPALPIFPDVEIPSILVEDIPVLEVGKEQRVKFVVQDEDSYAYAIQTTILGDEHKNFTEAVVSNDSLILLPKKEGQTTLQLKVNSNGSLTYWAGTLSITGVKTSISDIENTLSSLTVKGNKALVKHAQGKTLVVYDLNGALLAQYKVNQVEEIFTLPAVEKAMVVKVGGLKIKILP